MPALVSARAPPLSEMMPEIASVPALTPTVASAARATAPVHELSPSALSSAPVPPIPVPLSVRSSPVMAMPISSSTRTAAPEATVVPSAAPVAPSEPASRTVRIPELTSVAPV